MYERFTDRVRQVMRRANELAERWNHRYIGTEHVLLAIVEREGGATAILRRAGISLEEVQLEIEESLELGPARVVKPRRWFEWWRGDSKKVPQAPRAKRVIESAMNECQGLRHRAVGTEHLLLGLLKTECAASAILIRHGLNIDEARKHAADLVAQSAPN